MRQVGRRSRRGPLEFPRVGVTASAVVLALVLGLMGSAVAGARGLKTGFIDPLFTSPDAALRQTWLDWAARDGANIVRINVDWDVVAPTQPATPRNPADPSYHFSWLDDAVKSADARGLGVMLTVLRAPPWAEGKNRPTGVRRGAWKPDPRAYGQFAQALASRYSGQFGGLPHVRHFEAWNEPNLTTYLAPQWEGKRRVSPDRYRRLLNAFYAGVKAAQPGAVVIGGAMSPFGDSRGDPLDPRNPRIRPLVFERDLFCLSRKLKGTSCGKKPRLDVLSQHPINELNPPDYSAISPDDVQVADFHELRRVLRAAERVNHVRPAGRHRLWATEIWWHTKPPADPGVPVARQARWLEESMYMLWKQGASAVVQFYIRDPVNAGSFLSPASGVFFYNGKKKPAYRAWGFPFVTHRKSKKKISAWGKAPKAGELKIQRKKGGRWRTKEKLRVLEGQVFKRKMRVRGKAKLRAKVGKTKSLPWSQGG